MSFNRLSKSHLPLIYFTYHPSKTEDAYGLWIPFIRARSPCENFGQRLSYILPAREAAKHSHESIGSATLASATLASEGALSWSCVINWAG